MLPITIHAPTARIVLLIGLLAALAGACQPLPDPIQVINESDAIVGIWSVTDEGSESRLSLIGPDYTADVDVGECLDADLEARLAEGEVVAVREGPVCGDGPFWQITQAQVDAVQGRP